MTKSYWFVLLIILGLAFGPPLQAKKSAEPLNEAQVGQVTVNMAAPDGLTRVDGLTPAADAYIKALEPKLKLKVLALYADPADWTDFVDAVSARQPAAIPRMAMICVPAKMSRKSFDAQAVRKEQARYTNWFSLAAHNRPMAALLTAHGNKKLKEYLGVDIGFEFKTDEFTKKFAETSNSISFGSQVSFNVFGKVSQVFLTTTSLAVDDKMIFLAYFEKSGPAEQLQSVQAKTLAWRNDLSGRNAHE